MRQVTIEANYLPFFFSQNSYQKGYNYSSVHNQQRHDEQGFGHGGFDHRCQQNDFGRHGNQGGFSGHGEQGRHEEQGGFGGRGEHGEHAGPGRHGGPGGHGKTYAYIFFIIF